MDCFKKGSKRFRLYMNELPEKIIRLDDGAEFVLNENQTYSIKCMIPFRQIGHLINEYTFDQLMINNAGYFKISDGTEDLEEMRKNWVKRYTHNNDGHGDYD